MYLPFGQARFNLTNGELLAQYSDTINSFPFPKSTSLQILINIWYFDLAMTVVYGGLKAIIKGHPIQILDVSSYDISLEILKTLEFA